MPSLHGHHEALPPLCPNCSLPAASVTTRTKNLLVTAECVCSLGHGWLVKWVETTAA